MVYSIIEEHERFSEKSLSELYDPDLMPLELRKIHRQLDLVIDECYRKKPFQNEEERLEHLFNLYAQMSDLQPQQELTHA